MKCLFVFAMSAGLLSPVASKAEISEEIHKRCLDAKDYSGCVKTNHSSGINLKKEIIGIGVNLFLNSDTSEVTILSVLKGTPAFFSDIKSGDVILVVDGKSTKGMSINEVIELIKGPKDKPVKLVLGRTNEKGKTKKIKIRLARDTFEIPKNEFLNQMKIREWFNRELPSELNLMLQQNGKALR